MFYCITRYWSWCSTGQGLAVIKGAPVNPGLHGKQPLNWCAHVCTFRMLHSSIIKAVSVQQQQQQQPFYGPLSGTTRVSWYQKKHSPTNHPDHHPIFISFFHLPWSIASSLFKLHAWQSFCTTSFHVLFGLPLGLEPFTSYSIHFFTQSVSSFRSACPYHHNLFCCSINIILSSIPSLSLNCLLGTLSFTLTLHIHLTIENWKKLVKQQYLQHMSSQYGELWPTNGWDWLASLGHPCKFQRVSRLGFVTVPMSLNGGQPNFARCLAISWAAIVLGLLNYR